MSLPKVLGGLAVAALAGGLAAAAERATRMQGVVSVDAPDGFAVDPDETLEITAEGGTRLHVEIDLPAHAGGEVDDDGGWGRRRPTVVMSHGFTLSSASWVFQRKALRDAGFRVVSWDQRCHGRSGRAPLASCTIETLGSDLATVIREVAPSGPLVLVGHSMGGMTMMEFGRQHPDLVRDRVIAAAFVATSAGGAENFTGLGMGELVGNVLGFLGPGVLSGLGAKPELFARALRLGKGVRLAAVERWSFDSPVSSELVNHASDLIFATPPEVMGAFLSVLNDLDEREALAAYVGIETLVVNGAGDLLTPVSHSEEIVRRIPGAEHVVVEEAGHLIMLEHPTPVNQQLLMLVERARRAGEEGVSVSRKPRVRRRITDIAKKRRVAQAREEAAS